MKDVSATRLPGGLETTLQVTSKQLYFGLDCGMMEFFTYEPQPKDHVSPAFMEYGLAKKIAA